MGKEPATTRASGITAAWRKGTQQREQDQSAHNPAAKRPETCPLLRFPGTSSTDDVGQMLALPAQEVGFFAQHPRHLAGILGSGLDDRVPMLLWCHSENRMVFDYAKSLVDLAEHFAYRAEGWGVIWRFQSLQGRRHQLHRFAHGCNFDP
jgi:hypothetical protein